MADQPLILVIEDNEVIYELILYKLRKEGFQVEHRDNGKKGLEAVKEVKPDLVILDVMLPSMNGFDVLRNIKEDDEIKDTKVIMLTSKNREEDIIKAHDLGALRFIEKPFKPNILILRIKEVLNS